MRGELVVGVVATPRPWRVELHAHVRNHVAAIRLVVLREPRTALEEDLDVLVVDDVASFLTPGLVRRLREAGVRIVGVFDPTEAEGYGERYLTELGADLTLPATATATELVAAISAFAPTTQVRAEIAALEEAWAGTESERRPAPRGQVIAVAGPSGSPGATEVAIALGESLGRRGEATVVLDADDLNPSLARRLGYELEPNLLSVIDDVAHGRGTLAGCLGVRGPAARGVVHFHAVPGLPAASDWELASEVEVLDVIEALRRRVPRVVVNVGSRLDDLGAEGHERFAVARALVGCADEVVGVCGATPLGILRFLDWAAELHALSAQRSLWVVLNRTPARFRQAQLVSQLREHLPAALIAGLVIVAEDERVAGAAWAGEMVGAGAFTRAIAHLAGAVSPPLRQPRQHPHRAAATAQARA